VDFRAPTKPAVLKNRLAECYTCSVPPASTSTRSFNAGRVQLLRNEPTTSCSGQNCHGLTVGANWNSRTPVGVPFPILDGSQLAHGRIERSVPIRYSLDEGLDVGEDTGTPVNLSYDVPFKFTGKDRQGDY